jgi:hypothetical protein
MTVDADSPVGALCAAGMAVDGDPPAALALFEQAWAARRNEYDACIAAHFVARHQRTIDAALHWNTLAVRHAEAVPDGRATPFLASLYLNLGDAQLRAGHRDAAQLAAARARAKLGDVPDGSYRDFVEYGIRGLEQRLVAIACPPVI